jgi:hypothetical protein
MTNEELLAQSTAAAKKAAEMIGGDFTQGSFDSGGNVVGGFTPPSNIVDTGTLGNNPQITFPELKQTDYSTGLTSSADLSALQNEAVNKNTQSQADILKQFQDMLGTPPSTADAYTKAQEQTGILEKQKTVNDLTATLNSIVNKGKEAQLTLESQASGRDITGTFLGRQQQEISRQTAIQSLPVSAQLSAAQGNLSMAENNLNTLFKIYSDDATNAYNYRKDIAITFKEVATNAESKKLDTYLSNLKSEYETKQELIKNKNSIALEATKNGAPASVITAISNAVDYNSALVAAGNYLTSTNTNLSDTDIKRNMISQASEAFESVKGGDGYINPKDWVLLRNAWVANGGLLKDFIDNFSIYQNPNDTYQ